MRNAFAEVPWQAHHKNYAAKFGGSPTGYLQSNADMTSPSSSIAAFEGGVSARVNNAATQLAKFRQLEARAKFAERLATETGDESFKQLATFAYGALDVLNTLEALRLFQGTVLTYGLDRLTEQIQILLEASNTLVMQQLADLAIITTMRFIRNGDVDSVVFEDLDVFGIPNAQQVFPFGSNQGFKLTRKGAGLQWNWEYFRQKDMKTFANNMQALLTADNNAIALELRRAFLNPTNTTFIDRMVDFASLPIKALVNADSVAIPPNPYGVTFNNAAHTHYMYCGSGNGDTVTDAGNTAWNNSASVTSKAANLAAMLQNLREHYITGKMMIYCSTTEAPFFTTRVAASIIPGFNVMEYAYILPSIQRDIVANGSYDYGDVYNRRLGYFDGAEVWVKPWVPAGYMIAFFIDQPKPVAIRVPEGAAVGATQGGGLSMGNGDLRLVMANNAYPMFAQAMVRDFGTSAWERQNGVAFYVNSTSAYTKPSGY